ncbi:MAG TPA: NAD-dependent epimerase/dehydratase family protein [Tepidisphaeraceae bacterium]|jgi:NADH dehydrogenase|nr:NAD-dependent epimerase/dehydratase family protein [Tepidisphaeraceae bacterium]
MAGRVFVTGGSGFVGQAVIAALLDHGWNVVALARKGPKTRHDPSWPHSVRLVYGDLLDPGPMESAIFQADAVIHLVGIIAENRAKNVTFDRVHVQGTRAVVDIAKRAGVKRYIQMSAIGARADAVSKYHQTKFTAETIVRESHLDATIFRPSMIHGPRGDLMRMEAAWARGKAPPYLYMPYFASGLLGAGGAGMIQPVYVNDVARAFVLALTNPAAIGSTYDLGGQDQLSWPQFHRVCAREITGKPKPVAAIPAWSAKALTYAVPGPLLPFSRDQVIMMQEPNLADMEKFAHDFGWQPDALIPTLRQYAREM